MPFLFFFFYNFTYLFTFGCAGVSIALCRLSLVAASRGYSSLRCTGLLILEASLTVEPGLWIHGLQWLWHTGLSCSMAYGIFLNHGLSPCIWEVDSYPQNHHFLIPMCTMFFHKSSPGFS